MPEKDNTGMGERIQSMVEDAVASMDFEQLNKEHHRLHTVGL